MPDKQFGSQMHWEVGKIKSLEPGHREPEKVHKCCSGLRLSHLGRESGSGVARAASVMKMPLKFSLQGNNKDLEEGIKLSGPPTGIN